MRRWNDLYSILGVLDFADDGVCAQRCYNKSVVAFEKE